MSLFSLSEMMDTARQVTRRRLGTSSTVARSRSSRSFGLTLEPNAHYDAYYWPHRFRSSGRARTSATTAVEYLKKHVHPLDLCLQASGRSRRRS